MTSTTYQVTGMTCEHCVRAVTEEIGNVPGVSAVTVALVPGGASAVTVTSEAPLAEGAIRAALDEAGEYRLAGDGGDLVAANGIIAPGTARTLPVV
jgi:copper chaperone CopZ